MNFFHNLYIMYTMYPLDSRAHTVSQVIVHSCHVMVYALFVEFTTVQPSDLPFSDLGKLIM